MTHSHLPLNLHQNGQPSAMPLDNLAPNPPQQQSNTQALNPTHSQLQHQNPPHKRAPEGVTPVTNNASTANPTNPSTSHQQPSRPDPTIQPPAITNPTKHPAQPDTAQLLAEIARLQALVSRNATPLVTTPRNDLCASPEEIEWIRASIGAAKDTEKKPALPEVIPGFKATSIDFGS